MRQITEAEYLELWNVYHGFPPNAGREHYPESEDDAAVMTHLLNEIFAEKGFMIGGNSFMIENELIVHFAKDEGDKETVELSCIVQGRTMKTVLTKDQAISLAKAIRSKYGDSNDTREPFEEHESSSPRI